MWKNEESMKADDEKAIKQLPGENYEEFRMLTKTRWVGPFTIDYLLDNCLGNSLAEPPDSHSVYLISRKAWEKQPDEVSLPGHVNISAEIVARRRPFL
jgi:hypothetical protein